MRVDREQEIGELLRLTSTRNLVVTGTSFYSQRIWLLIVKSADQQNED